MTQRYKITVEYDGTDLLGWQKQLDGPSAQEFLEKAVEAFCQEKTEVYGAGRTDAGVHALAQIAHFDLNREVDPFRLREAVNAHLRSMEAPVSVLAAEKRHRTFTPAIRPSDALIFTASPTAGRRLSLTKPQLAGSGSFGCR